MSFDDIHDLNEFVIKLLNKYIRRLQLAYKNKIDIKIATIFKNSKYGMVP